MKKLVAMLLTMLPLVVLADVAPMSRDEWERHRQFMRSFTTPSFDAPSFAGYGLAFGVGVLLMIGLVVLSRRCSRRYSQMEWIVLAILIISCCVAVEFVFHPFSSHLSMISGEVNVDLPKVREESYEEYLFYERHCRRCGSALSYYQGRYCPKCNPRPSQGGSTTRGL